MSRAAERTRMSGPSIVVTSGAGKRALGAGLGRVGARGSVRSRCCMPMVVVAVGVMLAGDGVGW